MSGNYLAEMTFAELAAEMAAAEAALRAADYQERLRDWQAWMDAARERLRAVQAAVDARLAALAGEQTHGG